MKEEKLELLLRRLGASESISDAELPPVPEVPVKGSIGFPWYNYAVAASLLVIGAAVGWYVSVRMELRNRTPDENVVLRNQHDTIDALRKDYETKLAGIQLKNQGRLLEIEEKHSNQMTGVADKLSSLDGNIKKLESLVKDRDGTISSLQLELKKQTTLLAKQKEEWARDIRNLGGQKKQAEMLSGQVVALQKKLETSGDETARLKKDVKTLQGRLSVRWANLLAVYLRSSAPKLEGVAALRQASRHNDLLRRCSALRKLAESPEIQQLLDRIDFSLTRMDMLDITDMKSVLRYLETVRRSDLFTRIDKTIDSGIADGELRGFLIEAGIVIYGAGHVV